MTDHPAPLQRRRVSRRSTMILAAIGLFAAGGATGAAGVAMTRPTVVMAPTKPVAIGALRDGEGIVMVRGRVVETYGRTFVVTDGTGRALVTAGHGHDGADAPAVGTFVGVQGRFADGQLHAQYLVASNGDVTAVGPAGDPGHGPHDRHHGPDDADGPHDRHGPDGRQSNDPAPPPSPAR